MRVAAAGGHDELGVGRAPALLAAAFGQAELAEALHAVAAVVGGVDRSEGTVAWALSQALASASCSSWRHSRGFNPALAAAARRVPRA